MEERRRNQRVPFNSKINIESLYREGELESIDISSEIKITNISRSGIGFISEIELPKNHYFNCKLAIDEDRMFYCVLRIIRSIKTNEGFDIGGEFVGLGDILGHQIDDYVNEIND